MWQDLSIANHDLLEYTSAFECSGLIFFERRIKSQVDGLCANSVKHLGTKAMETFDKLGKSHQPADHKDLPM
jgi:hypothetical protein